jgi:hypothetical protein
MSEQLKMDRDRIKRDAKVRAQSSRREPESNSTASMSMKKRKFFEAREMLKQGNMQAVQQMYNGQVHGLSNFSVHHAKPGLNMQAHAKQVEASQ